MLNINKQYGDPFRIVDIPANPITLIEKVRKSLNSYNYNNFQILETTDATELTVLLNLFRRKLFYSTNDYGGSYHNRTTSLYLNHIADLVSKTEYIEAFVPFLKAYCYNPMTPFKKDLEDYFHYAAKLSKAANEIQTLNSFIENSMSKFQQENLGSCLPLHDKFAFYKNIFQKMDFLLDLTMQMYLVLQNKYIHFIHVFDHYRPNLEFFIKQPEFKEKIKCEMASNRFFFVLEDFRKIIFIIFGHLDVIMNEVLNVKGTILTSLRFIRISRKIGREMFLRFERYFSQFLHLDFYRQQMVNNVRIKFIPNLEYTCAALYTSYEDKVVPNLIRDCHYTLQRYIYEVDQTDLETYYCWRNEKEFILHDYKHC